MYHFLMYSTAVIVLYDGNKGEHMRHLGLDEKEIIRMIGRISDRQRQKGEIPHYFYAFLLDFLTEFTFCFLLLAFISLLLVA